MSELIIGTEQGIFALHLDREKLHPEKGPAKVFDLAQSGDGLYALTPEAAVWRRVGHDQWEQVHARAVTEDAWSFGGDAKVPGLLYIGVSPAMLYRSADGGKSWAACESIRSIPGYDTWTFPPPPHIPHIRNITADPAEPGAVFIGVEEGGIYRSADGGKTWQGLNDGLYRDVHVVLPMPSRSRVYASTGTGFHRSDDAGGRWRHVQSGLDRPYTIPLVTGADDENVLYTAAAEAPPPSWRAEGTANAAIYRSRDGGERWERLTEGLPQTMTAMVRTIAVRNSLVCAAAGGDIYMSENGGDSWRTVAQGLPLVRSVTLL